MSGLHQHQWDPHYPRFTSYTGPVIHVLCVHSNMLWQASWCLHTQTPSWIHVCVCGGRTSACVKWSKFHITRAHRVTPCLQHMSSSVVRFVWGAVLVECKVDLGKHPADTLTLACHDTESPLLAHDITWGFPCAIWDYCRDKLAPRYTPIVVRSHPTQRSSSSRKMW